MTSHSLNLPAALLGVGLWLGAAPPLRADVNEQLAWVGKDWLTLRVVVELASDVPPEDRDEFERALKALWPVHKESLRELFTAGAALTRPADPNFTAVAPPASASAADLLAAMGTALARLRAAEQAGQGVWVARQRAAARGYAGRAAEALARSAAAAQKRADELKARRFAERRPAADAEAASVQLKRDGLRPEHRARLAKARYTADEIAAYQARLQATPALVVGKSIVEHYVQIAAGRRKLAESLDKVEATGTPDADPERTFLVCNPKDEAATIDLYIRRVSVPPQWHLAVAAVADGPDDPAEYRVEEVEAGEHYRVRLPAKGQVRVASVVVPAGGVGADTTTRWAVEGKIGTELIGGIVQELHVPASRPEESHPPTAVAPIAASPPTDDGRRWLTPTLIGLAALVLFGLGAIILRRTRRGVAG
jgi:hypothetical protein